MRATSFPMPGAPFTSWLTLGFYACVLVLMAFDYPNGTWSFCAIPFIALLLVLGWKTFRNVPEHEAVPQTVPSIQLTEDLLEHRHAEKK